MMLACRPVPSSYFGDIVSMAVERYRYYVLYRFGLVSAVHHSFFATHLLPGHLMRGVVVLRHMPDLAAIISRELGCVSSLTVSPPSG